MRQYPKYGMVLGAALLLAASARAGGGPGVAERHQAAVAAARAGQHRESLAQLRALREQAPNDPRLQYDEALVLLWSGQARLALERVETLPPRTLPTYLLEPLAPAARDVGRPDLAAGYYAALLHSEPLEQRTYLAAAMVEAERGYPLAALVRLGALGDRWAGEVDYWTALAYVRGLAGDARGALAAYRRALRMDPTRNDAKRGVIGQLRHVGRPRSALALAERWQLPLDTELRSALLQDVTAHLIRRGERGDLSPTQRRAATQEALSAMGAASVGELPVLDFSQPPDQRRSFDLLLALRDARRAADVLRLYGQIESAGVQAPTYAVAAVADAHLVLRQPKHAEALYRRIGEREPANPEARIGLFYALVEQERFGEALAVVDAAAADSQRTAAGEPAAPPAGPLIPTLTVAAMGRAYADNLPAAQRQLEELRSDRQPQPLSALGTVYRWRGWPRRALNTYEAALVAAPTALDPALGRFGALLDIDRTASAQAVLDEISKTAEDHPAVQAAERDLALRQRPQFTLDVGHSRSSGSTFGSRGWSMLATGYGSPLTAHLRPLLTLRRDTARLREGTGVVERAGVGADYRRDGWQARVDLTAGWRDNDRPGVGLQLGRWFDDHWWLGGTAEYNSSQVPLRGQHAGVRGNRVQLAGRYRFDERRRLGVSYDLSDFNDGNTRKALGGFAEQRLWTLPSYRLDGRLDLYASRNTQADAIYYNPRRDFAASVTLDNHWRTWRRYENSFEQRFSLSAGNYKQSSQSGAGIWKIEYGHDWRLGPGLSIGYGVSRGRHVYDGAPEHETRFMLTLDARI